MGLYSLHRWLVSLFNRLPSTQFSTKNKNFLVVDFKINIFSSLVLRTGHAMSLEIVTHSISRDDFVHQLNLNKFQFRNERNSIVFINDL